MTRANELRELDDDELEIRLSEYRRELLNLRFQLATGQLDNSARLSEARKDVARVMTLLREREIAVAEGHPIEPLPHIERPPRPSRSRQTREEAYEEEAPYEDEGDVAEVAPADDVMDETVVDEVPEPAASELEQAEPVELEEGPDAPKRASRLRGRRSRAKGSAAENTDQATGKTDEGETDEEEQ
jgi:large subunit ribosomal protein L29